MDFSLSHRITRSASPNQPSLNGAPSIEGLGAVGNLLTLNIGDWSGATAFTYQWFRDGVPIPGADGDTYLVTAADEGHSLGAEVTAQNGSFQTRANAVALDIPLVSAWEIDLSTPGRFTIIQSPTVIASLNVEAAANLITIS